MSLIPVIIGIYVGIIEMIYTSIVTQAIMYFIGVVYCGRVIAYDVKTQVKDLFPEFLTALILFVAIYSLSYLKITPLLLLLIQGFVGGILFVALSSVLCKEEFSFILEFVKRNK